MAEENKHQRFVRIAERRTKEVLRRLRILGNCSNRVSYEYETEDVEKIFTAIQEHLDATRARFDQRSRKDMDFRL